MLNNKNNINGLVRCRDCRHWMTTNRDWEATYDRKTPPDKGWWDGVCKRLQSGITITASGGWGGAIVDSVETDGNFACIYGETPNTCVSDGTAGGNNNKSSAEVPFAARNG